MRSARVILNLVLVVILIGEFGAVGAAIGVDASYAVYVGAHLWICALKLELPLRPLATTAIRSLPAAVAMGAILFAVGTHRLGPLEWVVGLAAGMSAFIAMLIVTQELSMAELRDARRAIVRRFARV